MKKCYIAGKIGQLEEHVYKTNFEKAKEEVKELGMLPVSPVDLPHKHERTWKSYMVEDLTILMNCQCVYAQRNWQDSKGAKIEVELAFSLSIDVIFQK